MTVTYTMLLLAPHATCIVLNCDLLLSATPRCPAGEIRGGSCTRLSTSCPRGFRCYLPLSAFNGVCCRRGMTNSVCMPALKKRW